MRRPGALAHERASVPADVEECPQHAVLVADEHDRYVACARRPERARLGNLVRVADVLPGRPEDALLLELEDGRIRVPVPRNRPRGTGRWHRANPRRLSMLRDMRLRRRLQAS